MQMNIVAKVPTLLGIAQKAIATDLGACEMVSLGRLGLEIERERIKTLVVDENLADPFIGPQGETSVAAPCRHPAGYPAGVQRGVRADGTCRGSERLKSDPSRAPDGRPVGAGR